MFNMKTVVFDSSHPIYSSSPSFNRYFLETQTDYLKDRCYYRGHLYLSEVYDTLGVALDPDEENICYRESEGGIDFKLEELEDGTYLVHFMKGVKHA